MSLGGFDVCFALGSTAVGQALQSRLQPLARDALRNANLALPNTPFATLDVNLSLAPAATIAAGRATITGTGTGDLRMGVNGQSMVSLPVGSVVPGALANVPVAVSIPITVTLGLTIASAGGGVHQVVIDSAAPTVTFGADFPPADLSSTIASRLTSELTAILTGIGTVQPTLVTNTANALATAIPTSVHDLVQNRLAGLFPLPIDFTLPAVDPAAFCNIGLRDVRAVLLPGAPAAGGTPATDPCLAIATVLLPSSTGNVSMLTSPLPMGQPAGLFFDNFFLISAICCAVEHAPQFRGLPGTHVEPVRGDQSPFCEWSGIDVSMDMNGRQFHLHDVRVTLDGSNPSAKSFLMHLEMTTSDTGWSARASVDVPITLQVQSGSVVPIVGTPRIDVQVDLAWWVYAIEVVIVAILAVVSAVIGGALGWVAAAIAAAVSAAVSVTTAVVVGAAIGAVVGIVVGIIIIVAVNNAINSALPATVSGALGAIGNGVSTALNVIPTELQQAFGRLEAATLHFDDLAVFGHVTAPAPADQHLLLNVSELVVDPGMSVDLDRGAVVAANDPGGDIEWRVVHVYQPQRTTAALSGAEVARPIIRPKLPPALDGLRPTLPPTLEAAHGAAMSTVTGVSYAGLHLAHVAGLPYPAHGGSVFATSVPTDVLEPAHPLLFAVRTGEGRYAKCAAWQDATHRLHLRFALFDTPAVLRLVLNTSSRRGPTMPSDRPFEASWQVSWDLACLAVPVTLHSPVTYQWFWNGSVIHNGDGPLAGGVTRVEVNNDHCTVHTAMGGDLRGELCVRATDASGIEMTVCRTVELQGTESSSGRPPVDQLTFDPTRWLDVWKSIHGGDPAPDQIAALANGGDPMALVTALFGGARQNPALHTQLQDQLRTFGG
ncbi:hypothetical protein [Jatrophihabitans sp.]|uniref:hypothetical protein n=1 Tax=Jatrophihabitans sp. TaxID=1932789 RepID=UPI002C2C3D4F|nr:hypothetical protein [Jatrophihabitans sp.]